jgi:hypothetical protein
MAILTPLEGEKPEKTARPRAVLAALCLADELNVSDEVAQQVLGIFVQKIEDIDGSGNIKTSLNTTAIELVGSEWGKRFRMLVIEEFCKREPLKRSYLGSFAAMIAVHSAPQEKRQFKLWLVKIVEKLNSNDDLIKIDAALTIMLIAFEYRIKSIIPGMVEGLLAMLDKNGPSAHAGTWALYWINREKVWIPGQNELVKLISFISNPNADIEATYWSIKILDEPQSVNAIISKLDNQNDNVRKNAIEVLARLNDSYAIEPLIATLDDYNDGVRRAALGALAKICEDETEQELLSSHLNADYPWLDPQEPIDEERVKKASIVLEMSQDEVRQRYERLAEKYKLKLSWKAQ